jgi:hypothetical protein
MSDGCPMSALPPKADMGYVQQQREPQVKR